MSKKEWFEAWAKVHNESHIKFNSEHLAWAGFWIGAGIVVAALIIKGQITL